VLAKASIAYQLTPMRPTWRPVNRGAGHWAGRWVRSTAGDRVDRTCHVCRQLTVRQTRHWYTTKRDWYHYHNVIIKELVRTT